MLITFNLSPGFLGSITVTSLFSTKTLTHNEAMLVGSRWAEACIGCYIGLGFNFLKENEALIS